MAFSQSFGFGNHTLLNIENEIQRAIDSKAKEAEKDDVLDVIQESPTQLTKPANRTWSRTRSRMILGSSIDINNQSRNDTTKDHRFRRSKSDSTLRTDSVTRAENSKKSDNYSSFFRSEFHIPTDEIKMRNPEILNVPVSQNEGSLKESQQDVLDVLDTSNALDVPIFSDDINLLLQTEDSQEVEQNFLLPTDTLNLLEYSAVPDDYLSEPNEKNLSDELPLLDTSTFICPIRDSEEAKCIATNIHESLLELSKVRDTILSPTKNMRQSTSFAAKDVFARSITEMPDTGRLLLTPATSLVLTQDMLLDLDVLRHIDAWNLPLSILKQYEKKGVTKMFDWQVECLKNTKVLFEHRNLVYSAPTSAGKTLVSEILLLKTVLERGKKVLMILPFISVVREKMFYLQDLLGEAGYRVEGFFGGYTPPGGFNSINVAICTIEKANSIVNKLLEQGKLEDIGTVIVDEIHLISDPGRGYILELLLTKILYMSRKYAMQIQVITMSATLANIELLKYWLDAEVFITDFRPVALKEMIKVDNKIYDVKMRLVRDITQPLPGETEHFPVIERDADHVAQLCIETLLDGCSVIVFCPSKDWCENLAMQLSAAIHGLGKSNSNLGARLRAQINRAAINEMKSQLLDIPTGLDSVLEKTITYGCAFHHAGLTTEERDIVEASFKSGALKIIVATSTLSSGVNLPARRVIIRSPLFGGKQMSSITYRQMIGRAGRTGKDTLGESILICAENNARIGRNLITANLKEISSCLECDNSTHLKRALLEVISAGVVTTKLEIENFINCTLLSVEKRFSTQERDNSANKVDYINEALQFLIEYEFVRVQVNAHTEEENYIATRLGMACLASSMPPTDGLILFAELQKSRRCFVLESELHAVYLVTPYSVCYQMQDVDWLFYLDLWEKLPACLKKVGDLIGIKESFLVRAMRGQSNLDYKLLQIHKRFYIALALQELVNESPINSVAGKYRLSRGMLQSLQQMSSTFAGIVTAFCNSLQWSTLSLIVSQFKERLYFGVHRDLVDLMRIPDLSQKRARVLFDAGIKSLVELAHADVFTVEKVLYNALSFDSVKQQDNENADEAKQRNTVRNFFITGKKGITVSEAAELLVQEARKFVQYEIGVGIIKWTQQIKPEETTMEQLHMSCEESRTSKGKKKGKANESIKEKNTATGEKVKKNNETINKNLETVEVADKPTTSKDTIKLFKLRETLERRIKSLALVEGVQTQQRVHHNQRNLDNKTVSKVTHPKTESPCLSSDGSCDRSANIMRVSKIEIKDANNTPTLLKETKISKCLSNKMKDALQLKSTTKNMENMNSIKCENKPKISLVKLLADKKCESPHQSSIGRNKRYDLRRSKENVENNHQIVNKLKDNSNLKKEVKSPVEKVPIESKKSLGNSSRKKLKRQTKKEQHDKSQHLENQRKNAKKGIQNNEVSSKCNNVVEKSWMKHNVDASKNINDFFMEDESFELNTGVIDVLDTPKKTNVSLNDSHGILMNKSSEEIPSSQNLRNDVSIATDSVQTPYRTGFLRSYRPQRTTSPRTQQQQQQPPKQQKLQQNVETPTKIESANETNMCSSFELSDLNENSFLKHPLQLNASHILSCSELDNKASNFESLEVIHICGNLQVFKTAFDELMTAKRFGFSVGLQQQTQKRKPLIGGNLLLNQVDAEKVDRNAEPVLFQVNDSDYLAGVAFCLEKNVVYYMHMQQEDTCEHLTTDVKCKYLKMILQTHEQTLLMFDGKEQLKMLRKAMPDLKEICASLEDPKVANWLLQPDKTQHFRQMTQQFAPECNSLVDVCGSRDMFSSFGLDVMSSILPKIRCAVECCVTVHILKGQIENLEGIGTGHLLTFFKEVEMPIQISLCNMETIGFPANETALRKVFQQMVDAVRNLEARIYEMNGARFNLVSPAAVARVLGLHRKANGRVSTSKQILEKVVSPISQLIMSYRSLSATLTKNIQPLLKCVRNDRIHGQSITFTATGRISMTEPNLQNVAKDFYIHLAGSAKSTISCRSAFIPTEGNRCLISADFCQLEMRILAHLSQDSTLLQVMKTDQDIFTAIAARWNGIPEDNVSGQLRNATKKICYGIVYGMGMRSLADSLGCNEQEAQSIFDQFHKSYPGIRVFQEKIIQFARINGFVEMISGRRRYLENINEPLSRNQAERQAFNSTIQGSASDIAKTAILRIEKNISKYHEKLGIDANLVHLVLHVHDELIYEVPVDKAKKIAKLLSITLENCVKLRVPLKVRLKIGRAWGDLKEVRM